MKMQMKSFALSAVLVSMVAVSAPLIADDAHHPPKDPATAPGSPAPAKPGAPSPEGASYRQMNEMMETMHEQMDRLRGATDPAERQKLLQEHRRSMHQAMDTMRGVMGGGMGAGMMGGGMGSRTSPGKGRAPTPEMMQRRMDMMQMMMEQMMQHQEAMQPPPAN